MIGARVNAPNALQRLNKNGKFSFVLRTTPSHVSIPPNKNGTLANDGSMRQEHVLGKIQPSKRRYELAFVFSCATRLCE